MPNYFQRLLICLTFTVMCMNLAVKAMDEEEKLRNIIFLLSTVKKCNRSDAGCGSVDADGKKQFLCSEHDKATIKQFDGYVKVASGDIPAPLLHPQYARGRGQANQLQHDPRNQSTPWDEGDPLYQPFDFSPYNAQSEVRDYKRGIQVNTWQGADPSSSSDEY